MGVTRKEGKKDIRLSKLTGTEDLEERERPNRNKTVQDTHTEPRITQKIRSTGISEKFKETFEDGMRI